MGSELATLRSIRMQKQQLASTVANQLTTAKEAHSQIQTRLDNLLRDVEATQSELAVSENYINMLKRQQDILHAEDDELAGLLHPIRRCPRDILKIIFEYASQSERLRWFQIATNISHVCQFWRAVALETSRLWDSIVVYVEDKPGDIAQLIERTRSRGLSSLKTVQVAEIGTQSMETTKSVLRSLNLDSFNMVDEVYTYLVSAGKITHITPAIFGTALSSTRRVAIQAEATFADAPGWDFSWLLRQPKMEGVVLENLGTVLLEGNDSFPRLLKLELITGCMPSLASHLPRLCGLVELKIDGNFEMNPLTQAINMPNLLHLSLRNADGFPWDKITAPQLQSLLTDDDESLTISFLSRHPSLSDLDLYQFMTAEGFKNLTIHASQLKVLDIAGNIGGLFRPMGPEISFPPFPNLIELRISEGDGYQMGLEDLERFVKARCLPAVGHKEISLVSKFFISGNFEELSHAPWRSSSLLDTCSQTLEQGTDDATRGTLFLRWSHE